MTDVSTDVQVTEFEVIDPDELHLVSAGANGFKALLAKSAEVEVLEAAKADTTDARAACKTCDGDGTIMAGHRKCPDCAGSGKAPKVGESAKSFMQFAAETVAAKEAGVADSGSGSTPAKNCGTCNGAKVINPGPNSNECPDCGGTGLDQATVNDKELNAVDADAGKITVGAGGRETVDKSADITADEARELMGLDKATVSTADQNDAPDSDFAFIEKGGKKDSSGKTVPRSLRHFYIADAAHVRNALARASQSPFGAQAMPAIKAAAKKFDIEVSDDASKGQLDGSIFSAPNPALTDAVSQGTDPAAGGNDDSADADATVPGSPAWEAVDAKTATDAAMAAMTAISLLQTFCQREAAEVIAGEGSDIIDCYMAQDAICQIQSALGTIAQLAFHESVEAAKSLPDDEVMEKAGRRLAGKTVTAIATTRDKAKELVDHLTGVLGDDDPAKKKDSGIKGAADTDDLISKEIDDMTGDELLQLLDERDARKAAEAEEATKAAAAQTDDKAKGKDSKADDNDDDSEDDEDDDKDADAAKSADTEDTKVTDDAEVEKSEEAQADEVEVELTPEQIEARKAAKDAKRVAKAAKREQEALDQKIELTKSIEESLAKVVEQNEFLKATVETLTSDLEGVKKMAAPSTIVRTAPADAQNVAKARDEVELRIATLENESRTTSDPAIRSGNREIIKELRAELAAKN